MTQSTVNSNNMGLEANDSAFLLKYKNFLLTIMVAAPVMPAFISQDAVTYSFILMIFLDFYFGGTKLCRKYITGFVKWYFLVLYVFFGARCYLEFNPAFPQSLIQLATPVALIVWGPFAYKTYSILCARALLPPIVVKDK